MYELRYNYLILFIFILLFIQLPLSYIYFSGQQRAVEKGVRELELSEDFVVSIDNPRYISLEMERRVLHKIVVTSSARVNFSFTDSEGFQEWERDPENFEPIRYFYQIRTREYDYLPKETKTYYLIFESDPLLITNPSITVEIYSIHVQTLREDILDTVEPLLIGSSVITVLLFALSVLPKKVFKKKKSGKTMFYLSDEASSYDVSYLKEERGFSEEEIKVISILKDKKYVTEKEVPNLFDLHTFYRLYKMGLIEKITKP